MASDSVGNLCRKLKVEGCSTLEIEYFESLRLQSDRPAESLGAGDRVIEEMAFRAPFPVYGAVQNSTSTPSPTGSAPCPRRYSPLRPDAGHFSMETLTNMRTTPTYRLMRFRTFEVRCSDCARALSRQR